MDEIPALGTSTAAFIGWFPRAPAAAAVRVRGVREAAGAVGEDVRSVALTALGHFFACGGGDAWLVPLASGGTPLPPDTPAFDDGFVPGAPVWTALDACADLGLLAAPGASHAAVLTALQAYAARRRAFLVADCAADASMASLRQGAAAALVDSPDAAWSALYAPWIVVSDPAHPGSTVAVPPSGAVAGAIARVDSTRGIWRSPAGRDAPLPVAIDVTVPTAHADRDVLNARGINVLARFTGVPSVLVWGGRTLAGATSSDPERKYVPVRRLLSWIERCVDEGTRWVVTEANEEPAWARVRQAVDAFLHTLFRQGALAGNAPREAYFVRCDRTTMTQDDIDRGRLVCEIGVAPVRPAEFVIVRIGQWTRHRAD